VVCGTVGVRPRNKATTLATTKQDNGHEENELCSLNRNSGNSAEAKYRSYQRDNQKGNSPAKHGNSPFDTARRRNRKTQVE